MATVFALKRRGADHADGEDARREERSLRTSSVVPRESSTEEALRRLVAGLRAKETWAERELLVRFSDHVARVLVRILGSKQEQEDLTQEVFFRVLTRLETLDRPEALAGFVTSIAVFVARERIRSRRRRRWLVFKAHEDLPEVECDAPSLEVRRAMVAFYRAVHEMEEDQQVYFTLRFVEDMDLSEIASAAGVSLSTVKRRLAVAEATFYEKARRQPELEPWLKEMS